ncbi:Rft-1-domain-containing protein [Xylaria bambusicola]|uniref:Rft-1-domain-containing protein n=1 Tax=Xylaria bambusicola TaxID=326684 RepID=UPI0020074D44|nr:Rft-1-domain-containing protein [Xylaria bambusicola]KAI0506024.1 Rft-1-domain-containing protein [Xylaria bambusicola]
MASTTLNTASNGLGAKSTVKTGSAVRGASLLIILQIASRAVTFLANQLLLRFLTAQRLGVSAQLEVYYLSVLFFARESLRVATQRQGTNDSSHGKDGNRPSGQSQHEGSEGLSAGARDSQSLINISHLSLGLGLVSSLGLGWAYLRYIDVATASTPYLDTALHIYGIAALVELLSEPAFVVLQYRLRFGPRAAAESVATFLRCLVTFGAANWGWKQSLDLGVLPFALGQLAYGVGLLTVYLWYGVMLAKSEGFSLFPRRLSRDMTISAARGQPLPNDSYILGYFFLPTLQLAASLMSQSLVKHILTQGDTFLVSILSDPQSQGVYALANNYGSLLARLVFQPIEESSRNYFSKLLSSPSMSTAGKRTQDKTVATTQVHKARNDLQALLKFYVLLSIIVVSIGPYAAPLLVQIVAGPRWSGSGAGAVLARYCLYIPLLAVNGVAEAFVSSIATKSEVHRQSLWMGAFSCIFAIAGFVSLRIFHLGAVGLVYANAINMTCRIIWSGAFISQYFRLNGVDFGWSELVPSGTGLYVLGTAMLWAALLRAGISVGIISSNVFQDLITVGVAAVPYVGLIAYAERHYLMSCYLSIRGHRNAL